MRLLILWKERTGKPCERCTYLQKFLKFICYKFDCFWTSHRNSVAMQCYSQQYLALKIYESVWAPSLRTERRRGDRQFETDFDPALNEIYGLRKLSPTFLHHPALTWRLRRVWGTITSPRTVEKRIKTKLRGIHRSPLIGAIPPETFAARWGTLFVCETRYATPGYISGKSLHIYVSGHIFHNSDFIRIFIICHDV